MKKRFVTGLVAVLAFSSVAHAEVELSGNVTTVGVYQHNNNNVAIGGGAASQGDLGVGLVAGGNSFRFLVDQVELDLDNEFGENIRARADIDFRDIANGGLRGASGADLEQGYVTANIGVGNGLEFLFGKFNTPLGLESNDRHENAFVTYTPGYAYIIPSTATGAKLYYEWNDNWSFDLGVVNNLNSGTGFADSAYPSGFFRIGATWGDEGHQSDANLALAVGPETTSNSKLDYYVNGWGSWALGDYWTLGWELAYRQSSVSAAKDQKGFAGQLYGVYQVSDTWSLQARYAGFWEFDTALGGASTTGGTWNSVSGTGYEGMAHTGTLGATYQITDGAKLSFEYRLDLGRDSNGADAMFNTGAVQFAYTF